MWDIDDPFEQFNKQESQANDTEPMDESFEDFMKAYQHDPDELTDVKLRIDKEKLYTKPLGMCDACLEKNKHRRYCVVFDLKCPNCNLIIMQCPYDLCCGRKGKLVTTNSKFKCVNKLKYPTGDDVFFHLLANDRDSRRFYPNRKSSLQTIRSCYASQS